jgi:hypothetical protein
VRLKLARRSCPGSRIGQLSDLPGPIERVMTDLGITSPDALLHASAPSSASSSPCTFDDHPLPHFHARYGGQSVSIGVDPLTLLAGMLPPRVLGQVFECAALHQEELLADWAPVSAHQPPAPIPPLA